MKIEFDVENIEIEIIPGACTIEPRDFPQIGRADGPGITALGAFGKSEVESSAANLVAYFQEHDRWCGFTPKMLSIFSTSRKFNQHRMFYGLLGPWPSEWMGWYNSDSIVISPDDGMFYITNRFIFRCIKDRARVPIAPEKVSLFLRLYV